MGPSNRIPTAGCDCAEGEMAAWLDLFPEPRGWSLVDTGRMARIVQDMSDPSRKFPTGLFVSGASQKLQALQSMFPHNNISRRTTPGIARLHAVDVPTRPQDPIWIVDAVTSTVAPAPEKIPGAGPWPRYPLVDHPMAVEEARLHCHARVVLPIMDLVCLFLDEIGGEDDGLAFLRQWVEIASHYTTPSTCRARLIIVRTAISAPCSATPAAIAALPRYDQCFSQPPQIVDLQDRLGLSPRARFEPLRLAVQSEQQALRVERGRDHTRFSAAHLLAFFNAALCAPTHRPAAPFDLIQATRVGRPVDPSMTEHLAAFLAIGDGIPQEHLVAFVASALLLDAYPPGMHRGHSAAVRILTPC